MAFKTFGCKSNSVDTDILRAEAMRRGFKVVGEAEAADIYVINSCTVTGSADRDARNQVRRFKRQNPKAMIGVIGCYSQVSKDELLSLPDVDFVVGTADKLSLFEHLCGPRERGEFVRDGVQAPTGFLIEEFLGSRRARAAIKIQDGCGLKCSFCIVPAARGPNRSLPIQTILSQVRKAQDLGFQEVVLTGIHVGHYGRDIRASLTELLNRLLEDETGPRIRLSTLDSNEISDEILSFLASRRLCPHFHIALQSGSNQILSKMHRTARAEDFMMITQAIRSRCERAFIGVDVMVGFPGETDADFEQTVRCLERSHWTKLHVFAFSPRRGTKAAMIDPAIPEAVIRERSARLRAWSDQRLMSFLNDHIGRSCEVLVERPSRKFPLQWLGHTENYLPTYSVIKEATHSRQILASRIEKVEANRVWTVPLP